MKFHFESNLDHQREAIDSIVGVFEGAPLAHPEENFWNTLTKDFKEGS